MLLSVLRLFSGSVVSRPANRMDGFCDALLMLKPSAMLPSLSMAVLPIQRYCPSLGAYVDC
jgi:hypothetical protein